MTALPIARMHRGSSRSMNLANLLALVLGKSGAIVVGVLFLPIFHRLMGPDVFGAVAVILSMQAFALMADFGMSVLVGRDIAHLDEGSAAGPAILRDAEIAAVLIYGVALVPALAASALAGVSGTRAAIVAGCALLFLLSVLQNLGLIALLARKHYIVASATQVTGVLVRALATTAALAYWSASVLSFVVVQVACTALHVGVTRLCCRKLLVEAHSLSIPAATRQSIGGLLLRGRPLLFSGLAGAAVLQLDKPLLSTFVPPADISPYFLAMSFSALPTALLAAPIVQYFQPQLIRTMATADNPNSGAVIRRFTLALILVVALPSWALWQWNEPVIGMWLRDSGQAAIVSGYVKTLLPAFALGSLCYVPVVLLMVAQDFKYQAITSVGLTTATLVAVFGCAAAGRTDWVCYAYLLYFMMASASVWCRALFLPSTCHMARLSAAKSVVPLVALVLAAVTFTLLA